MSKKINRRRIVVPENVVDAPAFFKIVGEEIHGENGDENVDQFSQELALFEDYCQGLGAAMGMTEITAGMVTTNNGTMGFRYDDNPEATIDMRGVLVGAESATINDFFESLSQ